MEMERVVRSNNRIPRRASSRATDRVTPDWDIQRFACAGKTAGLDNRGKGAQPVQDPLIDILIHAFRHL
jgi:hypothetical protein